MSKKHNVQTGIDFLSTNPDNVYMTKHFIVAQHLSLAYDASVGAVSVSEDYYYERNTARDDDFRYLLMDCHRHLGKRVPSQTYTRTYIQ